MKMKSKTVYPSLCGAKWVVAHEKSRKWHLYRQNEHVGTYQTRRAAVQVIADASGVEIEHLL